MENKFTQLAQNALISAATRAQELGHGYIGSEHLLLGLMEERESVASKMLTRHGISYTKIKNELTSISPGSSASSSLSSHDLTPRLRKIIANSSSLCEKNKQGLIGSEHLLYCLLSEEDCLAVRILEENGLYPHEMQSDILTLIRSSQHPKKSDKRRTDEKESTIEAYGRNLNILAAAGKIDPTLCREKETDRLIQILSRRTKNNPCLIGEPGVGKTAIAEGLAARIINGNVPPSLQSKIVYALDIPLIIAGAKYRGEFEDRMKSLMKECSQNSDIILFIDEIHTIIGAGSAEGAIDAANILKPALSRGEIQIIGATTLDEYRKHIERDSALERRFQPIRVDEPSTDDAINILYGLRERYEEYHGLKISDEAIISAVKLSERYIRDRYLPDKAIDLIDEAASRVKLKKYIALPAEKLKRELADIAKQKEAAVEIQNFDQAKRLREKEIELEKKQKKLLSKSKSAQKSKICVSGEDIAEVVTDWSGVPVTRLLEEEGNRLASLDSLLKEKIIGQDTAIETLSNTVRRGRTGLGQADRPIGSFIFVGPTGVGKTELCLALAEILFGSKKSLLRFDMSEYTEAHSISKLIGAPPGYVGYGEGGLLTERIRRNPYSVVLFDEIEKAHPEIYNLMLQILEDGTLTDSQGRVANFKNTLIIMTSNVGSADIINSNPLGFYRSESDTQKANLRNKKIKESLKKSFRAEFLNRVDEIIIFNSLSRQSIEKICSLLLNCLYLRLKNINISVEFSDTLVKEIADRAFDERYGARNVRREISRFIENPLSSKLLSGDIKNGDSIVASVSDGKLVLEHTKSHSL